MALVTPNHPIHPTFDERISVKVEGQLPQFVKEDHATFVAFMEAYYEYMEQQGKPYEIIGNLDKYANLDKTTDEFLNYFKKEFGEDIPETVFANANKPFVLKHLRDFYRAKGSEKAFQFLFRLLYQEEISFYYPGKDILRTSDGKYGKSQIIRTIDTSGSDLIFGITGKKITGNTSNAEARVEMVLNEGIGAFVTSTVFLGGVVGLFQNGESITVEDSTIDLKIGGILVDYVITNPGNGYTKGEVIPLIGGGGSAAGGLFKVDELTSGFITTAAINSGGTGYVIGDKLSVSNTDKLGIDGRTVSILVKNIDTNGTITDLDIENPGRSYTSIPTINGGGSGTGASITLSGSGIGGIKTLELNKNGFGYDSNPTLNFVNSGDGTATGHGVIGGYEDQYQAGFFGDSGFLSSTKYIQDSSYYQLFSYVITSGHNITKWRDVIKRTAHPAGLALFGNVQIISNIDLQMKITGIPQRRYYTIIFHDGTIEPPVVLDVGVDACAAMQNIKVSTGEIYGFLTESITEPDSEFGSITDSFMFQAEDYGQISDSNTFFIAPTRCQTYEQDLGIQKLMNLGGYTHDPEQRLGYEEYFHIHAAEEAARTENYGSITEAQTEYLDLGREGKVHASIKTPTTARTERVGGLKDGMHVTQLRLGPIRRNIDRNKWRKTYQGETPPSWNPNSYPPAGLGGLGQTIGGSLGMPGREIANFKNDKIIDFVLYGGMKDRRVSGTTSTRFQTETGAHFNLNQQISPISQQFMRFFATRPINT